MIFGHSTFRLSRLMADDDAVLLVLPTRALSLRVEGGYEEVDSRRALWLFESLDHMGNSGIRQFVAEARLSSFPLSGLDDHELLGLVREAIKSGRVVAVRKGRATSPAHSATVEHRKLVRDIETHTRGHLNHGGRRYKLVADLDLGTVPGRDEYSVLPQSEAAGLLDNMAKESGSTPHLPVLLAKASEKLTKDWRPPSAPDGLVLLRRDVRPAAVAPAQTPAMTPSQVRAMVEAEAAITMLEVPEFIASGQETVPLRYAFSDPKQHLSDALLQIFSAKEDTTPLWSRKIPAQHIAQDGGSLDWNGKLDIGPGGDFPDGFATLAGSPYRVLLSAEDGTKELSREAQIRVAVAQVRLEVASSCLSNVEYQEVAKRLRPLGGTQSVPLRVSSFITSSPNDLGPVESATKIESATKSAPGILPKDIDVGHQQARNVCAGLSIPLVATVLVQSSQKKPLVAAKALGRARVLWDYVEPPPANGKTQYLHAIETHDPHAGPPNGRNTPVAIGGKRGGKGDSKPVLGGSGNGIVDFPFAIEPSKERFWAAFSEIQKAGNREGQAGIVFRPSLISGDAYKISAYLDVDRTLDSLDPIPEATPRGDAGWLEIWREVPVVRFVRKCPSVTTSLKDIGSFTDPAYLRCVDEIPDKNEALDKVSYIALLREALAKIRRSNDPLFEEFAMLPVEEQYDIEASWWDRLWGDPKRLPTGEMVRFRGYDQFIDACDDAVKRPSHARLTTKLAAWKNGRKARADYFELVDNRAGTIAIHMGQAAAIRAGVTVVGFDGLHNLVTDPKVSNGLAVSQESDRWRIAIMLYKNRADTLAHELGHCLFLPHAPSSPREDINGVVDSRHVRGDHQCLMCYGSNRPGFCAICLLRLRGADGSKLRPTGIVP